MYRAIVVAKVSLDSKEVVRRDLVRYDDIRELPLQDKDADVLVRVAYSGLNYKDGLVLSGAPGVASKFPLVPGIDFAGKVVEDSSGTFQVGQRVVLTGHYAGQRMDGGYSDLVRVPAKWLVALPAFLEEREAMAIGTAGFTAMQCVMSLERFGGLCRGETAPVLVTGAAGGVGSAAVAILSHLGYRVVASSGRKSSLEGYLKRLGAAEVIDRLQASKPLEKEKYAGVVDSVGGTTLAAALASTMYGRAVAACGLAGDSKIPLTVLPFILRGVKLLGVDSVQAPMEERQDVWNALSTSLPKQHLLEMTQAYALEDLLGDLGPSILRGEVRGRAIIDVAGTWRSAESKL